MFLIIKRIILFLISNSRYITDIHLHAKSNKPFSLRMMNVNILWTGAM